MVEHNNFFVVINIFKVVCKPFPPVTICITGFVIATPLERSNNIMNVADIKGIPNRSVKAFVKFLAILSFYIVVIADYIPNGASHSFGVHILNMLFKTRIIANVARVYQKCRIILLDNLFNIIKPFARAGLSDFCIGDLNKAMLIECS